MRFSQRIRIVLATLAIVLPAQAEWFSARLDDAEMQARLVREPNEVKSLLGTDLERDYVLVEVKVRPLYNSKVVLTRGDFTLRSRRNNDRSTAMSPEEIAGTSVLVLGGGRTTSRGVFAEDREPVLVGGAPGTGTRPRTLGGQGRSLGSGGFGTEEVSVKTEERSATSLLERLRQLELPIGETRETVSGYLYFQVSAKHKLKHYEFTYDGNVGEFDLKFK